MAAFDNFKFEDAQKIIKDLADAGARQSLLLHRGDHWQGSDMWIGPRPKDNDSNVLKEIERGLVSKNVVREVDNRHAAAVVGHEPDWSLTPIRPLADDEKPGTEEQALIDEAEAALVEFWDNRKILNIINSAMPALETGGRSPLRLFVPPGLMSEDGVIKVSSLQEAFELLYISVPDPEQATVYKDADTQAEIGIYSYEDKDKKARMELSFLNDNNQTIIISGLGDKENTGTAQTSDPLELGKHLTIFEMKMDALITQQVRQQQALLNMAHTMMGRNVVLGGFLERVLLGVELPGVWKEKDGKQVFEPNPLYVGAGTTNVFAPMVLRDSKGEPISDEQGRVQLANPSVVYRDPVSVTTFKDTSDSAYRAILEETHQLHALISGDATASGESRKQAMDDFRKSLQPTKAQIDAMGRWLLETALAMAAQFSGQAGRFKDLRVMFDAKIDVGKPTSDEIDTGISLVEKKVWKRSRLQTLTGVEDPEAEDAAILADEQKLEPIKGVQLERAKTNLAIDQKNTEGGIRDRLSKAGQPPTADQTTGAVN